jgi:Putative Ig domain
MQATSLKRYTSVPLSLLTLTLCLTHVGLAASKGLNSANYLQPYTVALQSSFGTPPYTYQIVAGSLPPGLSMDQRGNITGPATAVGTFLFQVQVTDSSQPPQQQTTWYSLSVAVGYDSYGGLTALPASGGASGFFRTQKAHGRWSLVSPLGNTFYLTSVFDAEPGFIEPGVMQSRYNNDTSLWAVHRGERMLSWGFNTLGEYTAQTGLPVGTWGDQGGNSVKLPFILLFSAASDLYLNPQRIPGQVDPIKNITIGVPQSTYNDYQGLLLDVFSPQWQAGYNYELSQNNQAITGGFASVPWIVGITFEDADYFWALKGVGTCQYGAPYPHPAFLIATTMFNYTAAQNPNGQPYQDPEVYSKYAWVAYLQGKYGNVSALNAAWGSNYTAFGDAGGYGTGTGVLDEDGRHTAWMGSDPYNLTGESADLQADMNAFLYQYTYQGWGTAVSTVRAYDQNHLLFGPSALGGVGNCGVRTPVVQALRDVGIQALAIGYDPRYPATVATNKMAYDQSGLPQLTWYTVTANQDSYWHGHQGDWNNDDSSTQVIRGQHYASDLQTFYNAAGSNGDNYILGVDWWALTDSGTGETSNFGLISDKDNAYDGQCAVVAPSTDTFGFPCGGETANYGDFLDTVTQTNSNIVEQLVIQSLSQQAPPSVLIAPPNAATNVNVPVQFSWTVAPGAEAYTLWVGTTPGGNDAYNSGAILTTAASVTLNTSTTYYARIWTQFNAGWYYNDSTFTTYTPASNQGMITTPVPGSTLSGSSVTFNWSPGSGATAYWLDVGSTLYGNQYYQSGNLGNMLSTTVNGLPTDGSTVYVTLWSLVGGQWLNNSYTYTAYNNAGTKGMMQTPTPGSNLSGSSVTFTWSAGTGATAYWLDIGNVPGGNQRYQSGNLGNVLTTTANGLPTDGSTLYATLYSLVGGQWVSNAYTYTAYSASGSQGVITTPAPGSTFTGSTVTFNWTAGSGATAYWLDAGNSPGGNQYFQSGNLGNVLTVTVNGLPTNGSTVYVTLYSLVGGQWLGNSYTYTAFDPSGVLGVMQTPAPGSTLSGNVATFTWSVGSGATAYWLDIGSVAGGNQYYQSGNLGNVLTTTVYSLPADGSQIYVTLYSLVGGQWSNNRYTYTSGP